MFWRSGDRSTTVGRSVVLASACVAGCPRAPTVYDTTSIMATIEDSFGLPVIGTRDGMVNNLGNAIEAGKGRPGRGRH